MHRLLLVMTLMTPAMFAADAAGHYYLRGVMEVGSELLLKPDGTFEYMLAYGAADYFAKGTWKQEKGAVVLTTSGEGGEPFRVISSGAPKSAAFRVRVQGPNGRGVPNIDVLLTTSKGELKARTDQEGVAMFPRDGVPQSFRFEVRVYRFESEPFPVEAGKTEYTVAINGEAIMRVPFKEERLAMKGNTLEMRFWDKDRAMNYVKE